MIDEYYLIKRTEEELTSETVRMIRGLSAPLSRIETALRGLSAASAKLGDVVGKK